jgi:hypothetical protein
MQEHRWEILSYYEDTMFWIKYAGSFGGGSMSA